MDVIRCSGDSATCERTVPRKDAERAVTSAPFIVRGFDLERDGGRWIVYASGNGIDRVRCPEHRNSVL